MPGKRLSLDQPFNKEVRCFSVVEQYQLGTADIKHERFWSGASPLRQSFGLQGTTANDQETTRIDHHFQKAIHRK